MSLRRWLILAVVPLAAIVYMATRGTSAAPEATLEVNTTQAAADPEAARAAVDRVVAERNKSLGKDRQAFEADGWEMVAAEPPDARLMALDPSLIAEGRERDLRVQLASTTPPNGQAHNLAQILLLAHEPATREQAALSLGRIHTAEAQEEIANLLTGGKLHPDDLGRRQLAALLRPVDLDDPTAARMADLLDNAALTAAEKEQVAFTLGLVSLRDGMQLSDDVTANMSAEAQALVRRMTELGQRGFLAHAHKHSH